MRVKIVSEEQSKGPWEVSWFYLLWLPVNVPHNTGNVLLVGEVAVIESLHVPALAVPVTTETKSNRIWQISSLPEMV